MRVHRKISLCLSKNFERFFGSSAPTITPLTRGITQRIQTIENKRSNVMDKNPYGNIWMSGIAYSNSEDSLESVICHASQDESTTQKQPWSKEEIEVALSNLPGGDIILSVIPTLHGDALQKILEEFQCVTLNKNGDHISLPTFADKIKQNTTLIDENGAMPITTAGQLLIKWPDTCLLISSWLGYVEIVKALLEKDVPVSTSDTDGRTPLHLAACTTSTETVEELLKHGADPCKWDFKKKCTPLHCAAAAGCVATVTCLIKSGADAKKVDAKRNPLYYAVLNNAVDCVEALLQAGACANNPQVYPKMPLHVAASLGNVHCTKLLLDHGARTETRNLNGQTAMHLATLAQSVETINELIRFGGKVDQEDIEGHTPLQVAISSAPKNIEIVKTLIQAGASVNKADKCGYTPLHIAALNESSHIVAMLLSYGGDITARTKDGITAITFIVRHTPEVLSEFVTRLDQAVSLHELGDKGCELRMDFRPLVPLGSRNETDLMLCLMEVGQGHMLKHPLCQSFLYLKWKRIRKFFLLNFLFHLISFIFFIIFICTAYVVPNEEESNVFFWPVLGFTCILATKDFFQITYSICYYIKHWENWVQWSVIAASSIILIPPWSHEWQRYVAAVDILLVWILLMIVICRFPIFGLYVQMFTRVSINFLKFLSAYVSLIIGFAFIFNILMFLIDNSYRSFAFPLLNLLKIMTGGELDYTYPEESSNAMHFIFVWFVILVTMILINLMTGLAVSNIENLRRREVERLMRHAEVIARFENMLLLNYTHACKIIQACRKNILLLYPSHHCTLHIRVNPRDKRLPRKLIQALYRLAGEQKMRRATFCTSSFENITANKPNHVRFSRTYNNDNQQQLNEIEAKLKKCSHDVAKLKKSSHDISIRLYNLIENIDRDGDLTVHL